ncbi:MAG TPA: alanine--tRNA ligase [Clostridia bacterium]|nr:alanine--tRNA ligase [Clostridia bacterium]
MKNIGLNELRKSYLDFFKSKDHLVVPSFSLVPENDPSILLINAGMTPLKPYFTGAKKPPSYKMATCQKCIRTLDIERVGKTDRHGTFFEMLGNFSFGDYFKKEAIAWAWEFFTKVLEIPEELLSVSVYLEDDEAYDIWNKEVGLPKSKIFRLGKEDNFWEHGTGPCGPCSEIFFDRGKDKGCQSETCAPGCDCDRFIEVWNLVFSQFDKQENGEYLPLKNKNIDTGMGLERLACVMQGVDNLFEVNTIRKILDKVCELAGTEYRKNPAKDVSIRLITDHIRSTVMMVSDGIIPSNEGRGYVLRRLLRRAARHGRLLGIRENFLIDLVRVVIEESGQAYPELVSNKEYIEKVIGIEEERFQSTVDQGLNILENMIAEIKSSSGSEISGEQIFRLHDTFGFPYELTEEIAAENSLSMDKAGFMKEMERQKAMARSAQRADDGSQAWGSGEEELFDDVKATVFTGYENLTDEGTVLKSFVDGDMIELALDRTPFYAESGGQVGDIGRITSSNGFEANVTDCIKTHNGVFVHKGKVLSGTVKSGEKVTCIVDEKTRRATERNHTATHILQYALRDVLGSHVAQAGSFVGPERMRFDFTHFSAMTPEEIKRTEKLVNDRILDDARVDITNMTMDQAREKGATALFGEKYGSEVRVVTTGGFSMELCGGTHLDHTSSAGLFVIVSESGVAAGVRRIEALTGEKAYEFISAKRDLLGEVAAEIKSTDQEAPGKIDKLLKELKAAKKEIENLKKKAATGNASDIFDNPRDVNGTKVIVAQLDGADMDTLRGMCDAAREKFSDCVVVLASGGEKVNLAAAATKNAVSKGVHAGKIIGEVAKITGGGGGGRPDMAQAGGRDSSKIGEALDRALELIVEVLK